MLKMPAHAYSSTVGLMRGVCEWLDPVFVAST
ncbi:MAG: hypothetical protein ACI9C1_003632, partial [Candidatus Aldehydirespiratoraceae bacterium]